MNKLEPCPFCTGTIEKIDDQDWQCQNCGHLFMRDVGVSEEEFVDHLNSRPAEDALTAMVGELEQANRWISVKDRLPERDKVVITARQSIVRVEMLMLPSNRWSVDISGAVGCFSPVTHWMPLPTPPATEAEADNEQ